MKTGAERVRDFLKAYEPECVVCNMLEKHWNLCFTKGKDTIKLDRPPKYCPECGRRLR